MEALGPAWAGNIKRQCGTQWMEVAENREDWWASEEVPSKNGKIAAENDNFPRRDCRSTDKGGQRFNIAEARPSLCSTALRAC